jgi:hypothetical protein
MVAAWAEITHFTKSPTFPFQVVNRRVFAS